LFLYDFGTKFWRNIIQYHNVLFHICNRWRIVYQQCTYGPNVSRTYLRTHWIIAPADAASFHRLGEQPHSFLEVYHIFAPKMVWTYKLRIDRSLTLWAFACPLIIRRLRGWRTTPFRGLCGDLQVHGLCFGIVPRSVPMKYLTLVTLVTLVTIVRFATFTGKTYAIEIIYETVESLLSYPLT